MKPIWMPFYVGDYLRDTMHLPREAHGSYLLLIMAYWNNQGPLPDDDEYLANAARCGDQMWSVTERKRLSNFFRVENGLWIHNRLEEEIAHCKTVSEARSKASRVANHAKKSKWEPSRSPSRTSIDDQMVTVTEPHSQSQSQSHTKTDTRIQHTSDDADTPKVASLPVSKFQKPSIEEILLQAAKAGLPEDEARKFQAYYESNGWRVGRNPMRNWHMALGGWKMRWEQTRNIGRTGQKVNRNAGTLNEGHASDYAHAAITQ